MAGAPEYYVIEEHRLKQPDSLQEIKETLASIPAGASLRTHEFFAPHAAHRKYLYILENQNPKEGASQEARAAEYTVVKENDGLKVYKKS